MDPQLFQRPDEIFRHSYCPGGVMTSSNEGFLGGMPSISAMSSISISPLSNSEITIPSPTPPERVVVINGIGEEEDDTRCDRSPGAASHSPPSTSTPLLSLVHNLHTGTAPTRVLVTTSTGAPVVSSSASSNKNTSISSADSPQIIVDKDMTSKTTVSEGDAVLESSSGGNVTGNGVQIGQTYVPNFPMYSVSDGSVYATQSGYYTSGNTPVTLSQDSGENQIAIQILPTAVTSFIDTQDVDNDVPQHITSSRHSPLTEGGVTYMVSNNGSESNTNTDNAVTVLDADTQANIAHATRVSPITVQWLVDNYETSEGVSLPRSTLYNHYLHHCAGEKLDPVNSASFGKLIRSVFLGLRTRRLGTRGNSKYHYYGIRVKPNSSLNQLNEDGTALLNSPGGKKSPSRPSTQSQFKGSATSKHDAFEAQSQPPPDASPQTLQNQQYLGDISAASVIRIPDINISVLSSGVSKNHIAMFRALYKEHCECLVETVYSLQFHMVETVWRRFWGRQSNNNNNVLVKGESNEMDEEGELASQLPSNVVQVLLTSPLILDLMKDVDYQLYQNFVELLIPDVLRQIPSTLTQSIRNFAKSLETLLSSVLSGYPQEMINMKVGAVSSLAQTLRRYTSLNHLAQAARAVLQNGSQISQMLTDLNRVDFHNVQEQASWVSQCNISLVEELVEDFKQTLQQQNTLEQWAEWLLRVVDKILTPHESRPNFTNHARQFLLKWSFYSSMVIRDLTLRSAASFGSFHLIRLLYDEYMFFLVEHKVAAASGLSTIAVMSQVISNHNPLSNGEDGGPPYKKPKYEES